LRTKTTVQDLRGVISRQQRRQFTLSHQGGKLHCRHYSNTDESATASDADCNITFCSGWWLFTLDYGKDQIRLT